MPLIAAESDANKRVLLQQRATTYMERAEEIKRSYTDAFGQQNSTKTTDDPVETSCSLAENPIKQAIRPTSNYKQLCNCFYSQC